MKCIGTVESSLLLLGHFFQRKNHLKYLHAYRPLSNLAVLCAKNTAIIFLEDKVRMTMQRWFLSFSYLQKWCLLLNSSRKICSITQCGFLMIFCSLRFDLLWKDRFHRIHERIHTTEMPWMLVLQSRQTQYWENAKLKSVNPSWNSVMWVNIGLVKVEQPK